MTLSLAGHSQVPGVVGRETRVKGENVVSSRTEYPSDTPTVVLIDTRNGGGIVSPFLESYGSLPDSQQIRGDKDPCSKGMNHHTDETEGERVRRTPVGPRPPIPRVGRRVGTG